MNIIFFKHVLFTLALLKVIGSSATTITPFHLEIRDIKMTQPFQVFYGSLRNQQNKALRLQRQFKKLCQDIRIFLSAVLFE